MASLLVALAIVVPGAPASADGAPSGGRFDDDSRTSGQLIDGGAEARVERTSTREEKGSSRRRRGGTVRCSYYDDASSEPVEVGSLDPERDYGLGIFVVRICVDTATGEEVSWEDGLVVRPGGPSVAMDPRRLAELQVSRLAVPEAGVATSPDSSRDQVVRVPTWLWVTNAWSPVSATAAAGPVSATVTATPSRVVWSMGDGRSVTCFGPGTPYDAARSASEQTTDCSHTYQRTSVGQPGERFQVSATVFWTVTFTSNVGPGGSLGEVSDTTSFALRVTQAQALAE